MSVLSRSSSTVLVVCVFFSSVVLQGTSFAAFSRSSLSTSTTVALSCASGKKFEALPSIGVPLVSDITMPARPSSSSLDSNVRSKVLRYADTLVASDVQMKLPKFSLPSHARIVGARLRRLVGTLGYAYRVSHDVKYLRALESKVLIPVAAWSSWGSTALDRSGIAVAVSVAYSWTRSDLTLAQRKPVVSALLNRSVVPFVCDSGLDHDQNNVKAVSNWAVVTASAVALSSLAVLSDSKVEGSAGVASSMAVLRGNFNRLDGWGLASGPTREGFLYTDFEASNVALVAQTARTSVSTPIRAALAGLSNWDRLTRWSELCGRVQSPPVEDGSTWYWWEDRAVDLAYMRTFAPSSANVARTYLAEQARDQIYDVNTSTTTVVPDGLAALIDLTATSHPAPPKYSVHYYAPLSGDSNSGYGCAVNASMYALLSGVSSASGGHSHTDVGNLIVMNGEQFVLGDLGSRDYSYVAPAGKVVWRTSPAAHSVVSLVSSTGVFSQLPSGYGVVSTTSSSVSMVSHRTLSPSQWSRSVTLTSSAVRVADTVMTSGSKKVAVSFLVAAPLSAVQRKGSNAVTFSAAADFGVAKSSWTLSLPTGSTVSVSDASPFGIYSDSYSPVYSQFSIVRAIVTVPSGVQRVLTSSLVRV